MTQNIPMKTQILLNSLFQGELQLTVDNETVGYMEISVVESRITVYRTVTIPEDHKNRNEYCSILLDRLVSYARENTLKIIPHCSYTFIRFKNNSYNYRDIWLIV